MQTSSYANWMMRPLSVGVCPTPDLWPNVAPLTRIRKRTSVKEMHGMKEETLRILKLLEEGKITADEANSLIAALGRVESKPNERQTRRKWLHIRVEEDGEKKVDVKIPLALLKFGFKFAPHTAGFRVSNGHRGHRAEVRTRLREAKAKARAAKSRARREFRDGMREFDTAMDGLDMGDEFGARVEATVSEALHGSLGEVKEVLDDNLNIDIEKILKMAQDPEFDGTILEVHDGEDGEHVTITLE